MKSILKNRIKLCSLFLMLLLLWGGAIEQNPIIEQQKDIYSVDQGETSLNHTNFATVQEACTPEQMGYDTSYVGVSHAFYSRGAKGRNVFGRLFCVFFILLYLGGMGVIFSMSRYRYFQKETNLAMLIAFIHDQDGKKSH